MRIVPLLYIAFLFSSFLRFMCVLLWQLLLLELVLIVLLWVCQRWKIISFVILHFLSYLFIYFFWGCIWFLISAAPFVGGRMDLPNAWNMIPLVILKLRLLSLPLFRYIALWRSLKCCKYVQSSRIDFSSCSFISKEMFCIGSGSTLNSKRK